MEKIQRCSCNTGWVLSPTDDSILELLKQISADLAKTMAAHAWTFEIFFKKFEKFDYEDIRHTENSFSANRLSWALNFWIEDDIDYNIWKMTGIYKIVDRNSKVHELEFFEADFQMKFRIPTVL